MPCIQGIYWLLTIPYADWKPPTEKPKAIKYLKGQGEKGENGYEHWQVLSIMLQKSTLQQVKLSFCVTAHAELSRSKAANDYVWKEDTRIPGTQFELGTPPLKRNSKTDWAQVKAFAKGGRLDEVPDDIFLRFYSTLRNINADYEVKPADLPDVCGLWLVGVPGCGKSTKARSYGEYFSKPLSKWWTGYNKEPNVIVEDLDAETCKFMGHFLKIWADKYSFIGAIHGSSRCLRPERIIVTSNYTIAELYGQDEGLKLAIERRFKTERLLMWTVNNGIIE